MKQTLAVALLVSLAVVSVSGAIAGAEGCSREAFAAYGHAWSGIPVLPDAFLIKPTIDETSCGYAVQATLATVQEWYEQQLTNTGWRLADRETVGISTVLVFSRADMMFQLTLQPSYGATTVLMKQPEPNKTMEPTR